MRPDCAGPHGTAALAQQGCPENCERTAQSCRDRRLHRSAHPALRVRFCRNCRPRFPCRSCCATHALRCSRGFLPNVFAPLARLAVKEASQGDQVAAGTSILSRPETFIEGDRKCRSRAGVPGSVASPELMPTGGGCALFVGQPGVWRWRGHRRLPHRHGGRMGCAARRSLRPRVRASSRRTKRQVWFGESRCRGQCGPCRLRSAARPGRAGNIAQGETDRREQ